MSAPATLAQSVSDATDASGTKKHFRILITLRLSFRLVGVILGLACSHFERALPVSIALENDNVISHLR